MKWTSAVAVGILAAAWIALGQPDQSDARFAAAAPPSPLGDALNGPLVVPARLAKEAQAFPSLEDLTGPEDRIVTVARGDTLMGILTGNGVDRVSAHEAVRSLGTVFDVRRLQIGQDITLTFLPQHRRRPVPGPGAAAVARTRRPGEARRRRRLRCRGGRAPA